MAKKTSASNVVRVVALECANCDHRFIVCESSIQFEYPAERTVIVSVACPGCHHRGVFPLGSAKRKRHK
jgi:hypothetical protein